MPSWYHGRKGFARGSVYPLNELRGITAPSRSPRFSKHGNPKRANRSGCSTSRKRTSCRRAAATTRHNPRRLVFSPDAPSLACSTTRQPLTAACSSSRRRCRSRLPASACFAVLTRAGTAVVFSPSAPSSPNRARTSARADRRCPPAERGNGRSLPSLSHRRSVPTGTLSTRIGAPCALFRAAASTSRPSR